MLCTVQTFSILWLYTVKLSSLIPTEKTTLIEAVYLGVFVLFFVFFWGGVLYFEEIVLEE